MRELSGGEGFLEQRTSVHQEAQRAGGRRPVPLADRGGVGIRSAGGHDHGHLRWSLPAVGESAFEDPVVHEIAWHYRDSGRQTQPVGQKDPNTFGLHDMLGNVWEWVSDWYSRYPGGAVTDPVGPRTGRGRVARGGSWSDFRKKYFRTSYRRVFQPRHRGDELGFRLVRTE